MSITKTVAQMQKLIERRKKPIETLEAIDSSLDTLLSNLAEEGAKLDAAKATAKGKGKKKEEDE